MESSRLMFMSGASAAAFIRLLFPNLSWQEHMGGAIFLTLTILYACKAAKK